MGETTRMCVFVCIKLEKPEQSEGTGMNIEYISVNERNTVKRDN